MNELRNRQPQGPITLPPRTVPAEWIDYNGHMNVAYYGMAFDQSLDEFFNSVLGIGANFVRERGMGPYVLQCHTHYLSELLKGEAFRVRVTLLDSDNKRIHVFLEMLRDSELQIAATSEQLIVNVDLGIRRSTPYPADRQKVIADLCRHHADLPRPPQIGAPLGIRRQTHP